MTESRSQRTSDTSPSAPVWLLVLSASALVTACSQVRFPFAGGRIALADPFVAAAFLGTILWMLTSARRLVMSLLLLVALAVYCLAAVFGRAGLDGAIESAQRIEQLFAGVIVFTLLLQMRRRWALWALGAGLALNAAAALTQTFLYGFGSVLPPKDVYELPWGFGGAYSGFFRDRVSLSLFLAMTLIWFFPQVVSRIRKKTQVVTVLLVVTAVLAGIAHGQILAVAAIVLITIGMLHSRLAAGLAISACILVLIMPGSTRREVLRETLSPVRDGSLKTAHVELVAAMRMAQRRPHTGVGPGRYQRFIGTCYEELPNPSFNDIESDTQSGLGILLSTVGFPAGLLLLLALLSPAVRGVDHFVASGRNLTTALAGSGVLAVALGAMMMTDPFVRGVGWSLALGIASIGVAVEPGRRGVFPWFPMGWIAVVGTGAAYSVLIVIAAVLPESQPNLVGIRGSVPTPFRPPTGAQTPAAPAMPHVQAPLVGQGGVDIFKVIDAGDATEFTPPFVSVSDSLAARQTALRIPDEKGTPPDGAAPDMKYGGAVFSLDIQEPAECKLFVRVWWAGSCGNTIYVKVNDGDPVVVGNDGTYEAWHWLPVPGTYPLDKGTHTITLLNREDGIAIDQILVTSMTDYYPQGIEEE